MDGDFHCYDQWPGPHTDGVGWDDPNSDPIGDLKRAMKAIGETYATAGTNMAALVGGSFRGLVPRKTELDEVAAHFTMQPDGTLTNNTPISFTVSPHMLEAGPPDLVSKIINSYGVKVNTVQEFYDSNGNFRYTIT